MSKDCFQKTTDDRASLPHLAVKALAVVVSIFV